MPELPEVETIRHDLLHKLRNHRITGVEIKKDRLVKNNKKEFVHAFIGHAFVDVKRRGKLLIFVLDQKDSFLLVHLKMTGQLIYRRGNTVIGGGHSFGNDEDNFSNKYTYIVFTFANGATLSFNDMRQFGYLKIVDSVQLEKIISEYGIEPLTADFIFADFNDLLGRRKTSIKAVIMNQALIAGIGNIYADESCYMAGIRPMRTVASLALAERKKLFSAIEKVLRLAVEKRGTTFNSFVDSEGKRGYFADFLQVYGRKGEPCKKCGTLIVKTKTAGRGTHFCPKCQK